MLITAGSLFIGAAQRFAGRPAHANGNPYRELETQVNRLAPGHIEHEQPTEVPR